MMPYTSQMSEDARECVSDAGEFLAAIKNYLREQGVDFGIEQK